MYSNTADFEKLRFEIMDEQSRRDWSNLIGIPIDGSVAYTTREFYKEHAVEIQLIQMGAAFRNPSTNRDRLI